MSGRTTKLQRLFRRLFPFLYKVGPCRNWHPIWDRFCLCRVNEFVTDVTSQDEWRGGIYDFKDDVEYHAGMDTPTILVRKVGFDQRAARREMRELNRRIDALAKALAKQRAVS